MTAKRKPRPTKAQSERVRELQGELHTAQDKHDAMSRLLGVQKQKIEYLEAKLAKADSRVQEIADTADYRENCLEERLHGPNSTPPTTTASPRAGKKRPSSLRF